MVVDMLTSLQEQVPPCVAPTEKLRRNSTAAVSPSRRGDGHPQDVPRAPDSNRDGGSSSASRSPKTSQTNSNNAVSSSLQCHLSSNNAVSSDPQQTTSSGRGTEIRGNIDESRHRQPTDKSARSCKRKLELTMSSLGSTDPPKAQDFERFLKGPESPPPANKWVIGPLFQSFKSKMASFTEIVMSPVRLFKPDEVNKMDALVKDKETKPIVVQRLKFDTDSKLINGAGLQNRSEHGRDIAPDHDGSCGSSSPLSTKSTNRITEVVEVSNITKNTEEEKGNKSQDQDLPQKVRLPTSAVRKRKKQKEPEASELTEKLEMEILPLGPFPTGTQKPTVKRRKVQVLDEPVRTCSGVDVRLADLNSATENSALTRASRSRTQKQHDPTPAGVHRPSPESITLASSRMTRQRANSVERNSVFAKRCCSDPEERLKWSTGKPPQTNDISQAKDTSAAQKTHVSKKSSGGRRRKRAVDAFEDQGMSMSLTLKLGSGLGGEKDARSIMTCEITSKSKKTEDLMLADTSCPSRTPPEHCFDVDADVDIKDAEADRRRGWFVYSEIREELEQTKEAPSSPGSVRLKRSLSCPDIGSLHNVNGKTLRHPSPPRNAGGSPSPLKRARRHTVCSVEVEREIAPLCLRKEVYPTWGGSPRRPYTHSPASSFASLVSCFLSSPLSFLSKKSLSGCGGAANDGPAPGACADSSHCSVVEPRSSVQQEGSEGHQSPAVAEELYRSALPDCTDSKRGERRKVSSIRIRKTLPKPQYNLTPMGLPKAVRLKKKVFSVEEIYTNKNFSKPPEGRLETIFEVPLSRRDGSQSLIGPKRLKRFVEFPELGVARKPKKPLVGGTGGGGAKKKKAAGNPVMGRTRRFRDAESLHLQDVDSLLCSKLNELDVWMSTEQQGN